MKGRPLLPVRLTPHVRAILDHLAGLDPGEDAAAVQVAEATGISTNAVQPILRRLVAVGWIRDCWAAGHPPGRKLYRLTAAGQAVREDARR